MKSRLCPEEARASKRKADVIAALQPQAQAASEGLPGWLIQRLREEAEARKAKREELQEACDRDVYRMRQAGKAADDFLRKHGEKTPRFKRSWQR